MSASFSRKLDICCKTCRDHREICHPSRADRVETTAGPMEVMTLSTTSPPATDSTAEDCRDSPVACPVREAMAAAARADMVAAAARADMVAAAARADMVAAAARADMVAAAVASNISGARDPRWVAATSTVTVHPVNSVDHLDLVDLRVATRIDIPADSILATCRAASRTATAAAATVSVDSVDPTALTWDMVASMAVAAVATLTLAVREVAREAWTLRSAADAVAVEETATVGKELLRS